MRRGYALGSLRTACSAVCVCAEPVPYLRMCVFMLAVALVCHCLQQPTHPPNRRLASLRTGSGEQHSAMNQYQQQQQQRRGGRRGEREEQSDSYNSPPRTNDSGSPPRHSRPRADSSPADGPPPPSKRSRGGGGGKRGRGTSRRQQSVPNTEAIYDDIYDESDEDVN